MGVHTAAGNKAFSASTFPFERQGMDEGDIPDVDPVSCRSLELLFRCVGARQCDGVEVVHRGIELIGGRDFVDRRAPDLAQ